MSEGATHTVGRPFSICEDSALAGSPARETPQDRTAERKASPYEGCTAKTI
jgi:hypothetical protein